MLGKIIVFLVHIFRMLQNFQQEYYDHLKFKFALTLKCVIVLKEGPLIKNGPINFVHIFFPLIALDARI
jgi:hypothetical protein